MAEKKEEKKEERKEGMKEDKKETHKAGPKPEQACKKGKMTEEEELQCRIQCIECEKKEIIDTLQRLQAEFENYRKRIDKEKAEFCVYAKAGVISRMLPVIDAFTIALKNKDRKDDFIKGMEMIHAELVSMLHKEGVRPIECLGKRFDPHFHDVLMTEEPKKDCEDSIVLEEFQKGYMLNEKVLRHSKVKISKAKKKD